MSNPGRGLRWVVCSAAALIVILWNASAPDAARATSGGASPIPIRTIGEPADDYPDGVACLSRVAIDVSFGSVCTEACVFDAQCPDGWGCKTIQQGNGEDLGLCFPRRLSR